MDINFEDAVDEILTGKRKSHTEASLANRLKSRMTEEVNIKEILSEKEEKSEDDSSIKKRISDKEKENDLEDDLDSDNKKNDDEKKANSDAKKRQKKEYLENLKRDNILLNEFSDCIYKTTKDPEGSEVFRVYMRINSENVNIKRFGRSEILQFSDLNSILSTYGLSKESLVDQTDTTNVVDLVSSDTSSEKKKNIDSFKFILKRISESNSSFEIICASKKNESIDTASAAVSSLGMITNFDTRQQALDYVDLQYSTLILKDIGSSVGE